MHLFNSKDYEDFAHRTYLSTKKNLENSVDIEARRDGQGMPLEDPSIYQVFNDKGELNFHYQGETTTLPNILDVNIKEMLKELYKGFDSEEREVLLGLLPNKN